ncbi:MAG: bifunctional diaminohydroxyphosphoribosylaminopyrimidine deaminase/5-amino-6-(5-phosphoribosylamino)uracil reductase RibD, partial [Spirochaetota bacterium]
QVVSSGGTQACGGDHAEICAIAAAGDACLGADLYVSLEPCCHHGKTPPCTDAIIRAGIKRVFAAQSDPDPRVSGRGIAVLREAGIEAEICTEFSDEAKQITRPFLTRIAKKRPMCIYKAAFTADGSTAAKTGDSRWVSSPSSRYIVHRLRSVADAVIVGKRTVDFDNPSLTCRTEEFPPEIPQSLAAEPPVFSGAQNGFIKRLASPACEHIARSPFRVCFGIPSRLDESLGFLRDDDYIIFENELRVKKLLSLPGCGSLGSLVEKGKIAGVPGGAEGAAAAMARLYDAGMNYLLLEGGGSLAASFFEAGCIDEYLFFMAPRILGGGIPVMKGEGRTAMSDACPVEGVSAALCGGDLIYHGYSGEGGF